MNNENMAPLASEMYEDLKRANKFKEKLIYILLGTIGVLVIALAATNIYHIHQWSQFDTYVVDSGDGGNANLVQGDNTGGIFNGTDSSESPQEGQEEVQGD
ncbi:MAG: hypothetical protein HFF20_07420 [Oscillospiraceae bacterium]|nr:hypothetical protein [Oscillospiraceae bacterium]